MEEVIFPKSITSVSKVTWDDSVPGKEGVPPFLMSQYCPIGINDNNQDSVSGIPSYFIMIYFDFPRLLQTWSNLVKSVYSACDSG